ncbi:MAG TPA: protein-glutamate O-methyltransferase CheR [Nannocystaceae bacterium]|nr:protein-glutamate O-methyltransferase CheR [Nannocystaceae bacterium]
MASRESLDPVDRFGNAIEAKFGLRFDDTRRGFLAEVLERRGPSWLAHFEHEATTDDLRRLAEELTVGESYFFRNIEQFDALAQVVLPARMHARAGAKTLRVLSAGCSSGEEPYSLAIVLREHVPSEWKVAVTGLDVNPAALRRAATGRYSPWALRETPPEAKQRWFTAQGREHALAAEVRAMVRFAEHNLAEEDALLWAPEHYDVIFCRNVLMYFAPHQARAVIERFERALAPGGYLFLGHAESLRDRSDGFALCQSHGTFYYERAPQRPGAWRDDREPSIPEEVRPATRRARPIASPPAVRSADLLVAARELMQRERYSEALAVIEGLDARDRDTLHLRAVLLTHTERIAEAQAACAALLALDRNDAGAHYLLALCAERAGEVAAAVAHDEAATNVDPTFAMPRLHLGLMARRRRELPTARRELQLALPLLEREDPDKLLLFGGGFARETLIALCCAELVACGGAS